MTVPPLAAAIIGVVIAIGGVVLALWSAGHLGVARREDGPARRAVRRYEVRLVAVPGIVSTFGTLVAMAGMLDPAAFATHALWLLALAAVLGFGLPWAASAWIGRWRRRAAARTDERAR